MHSILRTSFFNRPTHMVAQELLGAYLVRSVHGKRLAVMITETEAYDGLADKASHASKGMTERTKVMFGQPGIFYVYLCYGMYHMLNIVTRENGYPAAVLIRGAITQEGKSINGPGKLTRFLNIDKRLNGASAKIASGLWLESRSAHIPAQSIQKTPRIGVSYAGPVWSERKLRFILKNPAKKLLLS